MRHNIFIFFIFHLIICLTLCGFLTLVSLVSAEPALWWREVFDSPITKATKLSNAHKIAGDKGTEFPLKAVMTRKSIYILDSQGKTAKKIPLGDGEKTVISDSGMMIARMREREITILTRDNQIQGVVTIADPQPFLLPQHVSFELSPNGEYLVLISYFTNTIYFHTKKGVMVSKYRAEDLQGAEIQFSKDSRYVAIHVPHWGEGKTNGYLLFFNEQGEKIWQFDHPGCEARFDISSDGSFIILATEERLYSLNKKGKIIYEKELMPGGIEVKLSDDGLYTAVTRTADHSISLFDNRNGNVLWAYRISGFDSINSPFTSLDVSGEGNQIAVAISKDWTKSNKESFIYLFNKSGSLVWQDTFMESRIQCTLSPDEKFMFIRGDKQAYGYR